MTIYSGDCKDRKEPPGILRTVGHRISFDIDPWRLKASSLPSKEPEPVPSTSGMNETSACLRLLLLMTLQLCHLIPTLPPPVSNSSCLFTRCQRLYVWPFPLHSGRNLSLDHLAPGIISSFCLFGPCTEFVYLPVLLTYFFIAVFCFISGLSFLISSLMVVIQSLTFSTYYFNSIFFLSDVSFISCSFLSQMFGDSWLSHVSLDT